ncbi:hypothetical protein [Stappia indica]|uniref:hypothetical protein n=1 Tax=Stappia indica TaxID=538381 RepID=UPI001112C815|nr:hypothetical protein [Stappia indica]
MKTITSKLKNDSLRKFINVVIIYDIDFFFVAKKCFTRHAMQPPPRHRTAQRNEPATKPREQEKNRNPGLHKPLAAL